MAAVRCNNPECLQIFVMCDGPTPNDDVFSEGDPLAVPVACPYCGVGHDFTIIPEIVDLDEGICEFGEEERGYG